MKYLSNRPFSVGPSADKEANSNYADNWERTFGKREERPADTEIRIGDGEPADDEC